MSDDAPSEANGWLLPGKRCECDLDYRCPNHDGEAEAEYWGRLLGAELGIPVTVATPADPLEAYEPGDPKRWEFEDHDI